MKERWALCVLGAWVMGSLMMFVVAPTNFRLIDQLLAHSPSPSFQRLVAELSPGSARELLRYLASELNRSFFLRWNLGQLALGASLLLLLPRPANDRVLRALALGAAGIVVVLLAGLTPLITSLGRSLDFVPREPPPPALARFSLLHVAYTLLELAKLACIGAALYRLVRGGRSVRAAPGGSVGVEGQRA